MLSRRTHWNTNSSLLHDGWLARQQSGAECFDLTCSNPTIAGFDLDLSEVANALAAGALAAYDPIPFGLPSARQAVADYYLADHRLHIPVNRILLTVSTSEAYSYLFRLLCDPEDEVLYCQPGYPLFDYLADLDGVRLRPTSWLHDADGWHLDRGGLEASVTERTRAVLIVHPNNPTGHFTSATDRGWLDCFCAHHGLALIVDEVFLDYRLSDTEDTATSFLAYQATTPTFILSGISKISGLPQMKAAWIVLHGPEATMAEAAQRLDVIADTFLSMSTPLQLALPALLGVRKRIQPQILARLRGNLATLDQMLRAQPLLRRLPVEAGWYCCLTVPVHEPSEASAVRLLQSTGVHVHPGVFFGFEGEGVWVISLLTPSDTLQAGCGRLLAYSEYFE